MTPIQLLAQAERERREEHREAAHRDLVIAINLARAGDSQREIAQCAAALGHMERDEGNLPAAMGHYEESIAIYRELQDYLALANTLRHLGDIHMENECLEIAGVCYQEAMAIYMATPVAPPLDFANALRSVAIYRRQSGDAEAADRLWRSTQEIYTALGIHAGTGKWDLRMDEPPMSHLKAG